MPETAKRTARVPILGDNGRISDDYIPAAIGENVTKAESAATRAETAANGAEGSASAASQSAAQASDSASAASESARQAQQSAAAAGGAATSAQSAQTAAEAAKTAAAGSARDAQQSATAAASSAASVADKFIASAQATTLEPGSQATASVDNQVLTIGVPKGDKGDTGEKGDTGTGVPDGGEPGQLLSKTDSGTAWVDPPSGNVLTGTTPDGYVAHAEDAYAQKPIEVRVKGRTVKNLWPVIAGTQDGLTIATDETGLITVSGTATASGHVRAKVSGLAENKDVSAVKSGGTMAVSLQAWNAGAYVRDVMTVNTSASTANTGTGFDTIYARINYTNGETYNASFRVMLVDGTEVPDCFTPPASITSVQTGNLVTAGKNLLSSSTFAEGSSRQGILNFSLPAGTYTLSCYNAEDWWTDASNGSRWYIHDADSNAISLANMGSPSVGSRSHGTFTLPYSSDFTLYTYIVDVAEMATDLQLELGSTATAYEPPNVTQTPLPEVELRGLPDGTCDELVIKSDGTCEVERRTQLSGDEVTALPEPTTEPQSPVSLPQLPAPTFNAYHESQVPSDTSVEYARDINIVIDNLAKQIAGTAATVAINEATR